MLLAAVVVLGAVAWLAPDRDGTGVTRPLLPQAADRPGAILIERAGQATLEFARDGDHWFMRAPRKAPAHPRRIRDLLEVPSLPVAATLAVDRASRAAFGLDPPPVILRLDGQAVSFGTTDALDGRRYVLQDGQVHLVAERVFAQMLQDPEFFVDPRLLRDGLLPVHIATPLRQLELVDGAWRDTATTGDPAAADVAQAWLDSEAQAVQFADTPVPDAGIVTIGLARGAAIVYAVLQQDGQTWLARRDLGLRYAMAADQLRALALPEPAASAAP